MDSGELGEIFLRFQRTGIYTGVWRRCNAAIDDIGVEPGELLVRGKIWLSPVKITRNIFHVAVARGIWSLFNSIHFLSGRTVCQTRVFTVGGQKGMRWPAIRAILYAQL